MARPSKFTRDEILDAARDAIARHGRGATVAHIAREIDAPTGSLYHRFGSREELLVALWLRSIRRFHVGLLEAAALGDSQAALLEMVRHFVRYCSTFPSEAMAMTLYRQESLRENCPSTLTDQVATLNDAVTAAVTALCARRYPDPTPYRVDLVITAVQRLPYGLIRPYVGAEIPVWMEDCCVAGAGAVLALGD